MQLTYDLTPARGFAGMIATTENINVRSFAASGSVPFGSGCVTDTENPRLAFLPLIDKVTITLSTQLITGNKINGKVNGVAIAEVTYDTSAAHTSTHIIEAIRTVVPDATTITITGTDTVITIETNGIALVVSDWAVTGGATQPTVTPADVADYVFAGFAIHDYKMADSAGVCQYTDSETLPLLTRGTMLVNATGAVTYGADVYVVAAAGATCGQVTATSGGNIATGAKFRETTTGAGLVEIEINLV